MPELPEIFRTLTAKRYDILLHFALHDNIQLFVFQFSTSVAQRCEKQSSDSRAYKFETRYLFGKANLKKASVLLDS